MARELFCVARDDALKEALLIGIEVLSGENLEGQIRPSHGMGGHETPAVSHDGGLGFLLVFRLAIIDHDEAFLGEIQVRRDATLDGGLGNERIEVLSD